MIQFRQHIIALSIIAAATFGFTACSDDEPTPDTRTVQERLRVDEYGNPYVENYKYPSLAEFRKYALGKVWIPDYLGKSGYGRIQSDGSVVTVDFQINVGSNVIFTDESTAYKTYYYFNDANGIGVDDFVRFVRVDYTYDPATGWVVANGKKFLRVIELSGDRLTAIFVKGGISTGTEETNCVLATFSAEEPTGNYALLYDTTPDTMKELTACSFDEEGRPYFHESVYPSASEFVSLMAGKKWEQKYSLNMLPGYVSPHGDIVYKIDCLEPHFYSFELTADKTIKLQRYKGFKEETFAYSYNHETGIVTVPDINVEFRVVDTQDGYLRILMDIATVEYLGKPSGVYQLLRFKSM